MAVRESGRRSEPLHTPWHFLYSSFLLSRGRGRCVQLCGLPRSFPGDIRISCHGLRNSADPYREIGIFSIVLTWVSTQRKDHTPGGASMFRRAISLISSTYPHDISRPATWNEDTLSLDLQARENAIRCGSKISLSWRRRRVCRGLQPMLYRVRPERQGDLRH